jgi:hypothetical protein
MMRAAAAADHPPRHGSVMPWRRAQTVLRLAVLLQARPIISFQEPLEQ